MRIVRLLLIGSVLVTAYSASLALYLFPWAWLALGIGTAYALANRRQRLSAYGTARWAAITDLPEAQDA